MNGGVYGIEVVDMVSRNFSTVWPFSSPFGAAVTFLPSAKEIWGASQGNIEQFKRSNGVVLANYVVGTNGAYVPPRGLAITPNGRVVYTKSYWTGSSNIGFNGYQYYVGLIGGRSLTLSNPPSDGGTGARPSLAA